MFGLGFAEILIIIVIAILFLGPDKLPSAMVDVAKFFRNVKKTVTTVKESIDQEMNVSEIKEEALAYKKELLSASEDLKRTTDMTELGSHLTSLHDDVVSDTTTSKPTNDAEVVKSPPKPETITFEKKSKIKEDSTNV